MVAMLGGYHGYHDSAFCNVPVRRVTLRTVPRKASAAVLYTASSVEFPVTMMTRVPGTLKKI